MRRNQLLAISWILMWVGAILLVACWLTRLWFQMVIPFAPASVVALCVGVSLFFIAHRLH
ncbi:hypothetical protein [Alicyclobacillus dauci]|uniref:Uncharacterized protein n=1 Tax=Alicyclobacillus dauci TaxID=1475485 RepID=A0ABY6YY22_9BACL|nr:hypothetical protein [Alicyclobacillus dauci]WAH35517.1 hypothetical protein NZD86_14600 [Alicyclobacillus dauci]